MTVLHGIILKRNARISRHGVHKSSFTHMDFCYFYRDWQDSPGKSA